MTILEYERSIDQRIFRIVQEKSEVANAVDSTRTIYELRQQRDKKSWASGIEELSIFRD